MEWMTHLSPPVLAVELLAAAVLILIVAAVIGQLRLSGVVTAISVVLLLAAVFFLLAFPRQHAFAYTVTNVGNQYGNVAACFLVLATVVATESQQSNAGQEAILAIPVLALPVNSHRPVSHGFSRPLRPPRRRRRRLKRVKVALRPRSACVRGANVPIYVRRAKSGSRRLSLPISPTNTERALSPLPSRIPSTACTEWSSSIWKCVALLTGYTIVTLYVTYCFYDGYNTGTLSHVLLGFSSATLSTLAWTSWKGRRQNQHEDALTDESWSECCGSDCFCCESSSEYSLYEDL